LLSTPYKSSKIKWLRDLSRLGMARSHHGLTIANLETLNKEVDMKGKPSRRGFLKLAAMAGLGSVAVPQDLFAQYRYLAPVSVPNPLAAYPNRDWERMYRDIFRHDKTFIFLCCPNDTHNAPQAGRFLCSAALQPAPRPGCEAISSPHLGKAKD
jgi:hypothetical protein